MIEKIQERLLRFQFNDFELSYEDLLNKAGKSTMLVNRLRTICLEIYKTINGENPTYMNEIFEKSLDRISPRHPNNLKTPSVKQSTFGTRSIRVLGPEIWNKLPEDLKSATSILEFKRNIKLWNGPTCTCNFCKFNNF